MLRGNMHPAPSTRPFRTMTAPSCMGAFTKKMFFSNSLETAASSTVPLRTMSSSRFSRSNTIRAPVRDWDISVQASTVWSMACSTAVPASAREKKAMKRRLPTSSRMRRISGWKRTISATTPHLTSWFMIKLMLFIFRTMDSISAARNTSTPLSRLAARVL